MAKPTPDPTYDWFLYSDEGLIFYPDSLDRVWAVPMRSTADWTNTATLFAETWPDAEVIAAHGGVLLTSDLLERLPKGD